MRPYEEYWLSDIPYNRALGLGLVAKLVSCELGDACHHSGKADELGIHYDVVEHL